MRERPLSDVPRWVVVFFAMGLIIQVAWHGFRPGPRVDAQALPVPASLQALQIASFGDPWVTAKLLVIWLQAFDNQPGISIAFRELDYDRVQGWLTRSLQLDPRAHYPLLAASRLYGGVSYPSKQRQMLEFVYQQFLLDPDRRWRWLAHAAITAKHQLGDIDLALKYAQAITEHASAEHVPGWAKHMSVAVLEDMGELDAAILLIGRLLNSGFITDAHEIRFLGRKLEELNSQALNNRNNDEISTQ